MTLQEFRAWLSGFEEAIGDAPTPDQWAKIKAKLGEIAAPVVVERNPNVDRVEKDILDFYRRAPVQIYGSDRTAPDRFAEITCGTGDWAGAARTMAGGN